jgi:hypothetical protein
MVFCPIALYLYGRRRSSGRQRVLSGKSGIRFSHVVNSALLSLIAYSTVYFVQELWLVLPKSMAGLEPTLYHNNHTWNVEAPVASLLQGTGAVSILALGVVFTYLMMTRERGGYRGLLYFWFAYHAVAQSVLQFADPVLNPGGDVGQALTYLGVSRPLGIGLFFGSFIAVVLWGVAASRCMLRSAPEDADVSSPARAVSYLLNAGLGASLAAVVLLIPFKLPPFGQMLGPLLLSLFPMGWIVASGWFAGVGENRGPTRQAVSIGLVAIALAILVLFQGMLAKGIPFY